MEMGLLQRRPRPVEAAQTGAKICGSGHLFRNVSPAVPC